MAADANVAGTQITLPAVFAIELKLKLKVKQCLITQQSRQHKLDYVTKSV